MQGVWGRIDPPPTNTAWGRVFGPGWPVICAIAICQPGKCSTEWHAKCSQRELVVAASFHLCVCSCQKCHHGHGLESDWLWHGRLLLSFLGHTFSLELPIGCTRHRKRGGKEEEKEDRFDMAKCHQLPAKYVCVVLYGNGKGWRHFLA